MLRRSFPFLGMLALCGVALSGPAQAAIGNGMEPIVIEPWLPMVVAAATPAVAVRQCRVAPQPARVADRGGKQRLRVVQRPTCRA